MRDLIRDRLNELTVETWWDGYQYTEIRDKDYIANCILDDFHNLILERIESLKQQRLVLGNSIQEDNDLRVVIKELTDLIR